MLELLLVAKDEGTLVGMGDTFIQFLDKKENLLEFRKWWISSERHHVYCSHSAVEPWNECRDQFIWKHKERGQFIHCIVPVQDTGWCKNALKQPDDFCPIDSVRL